MKFMALNPMLFDRAKRLKISKPDLDNNAFIFKANKKVFKNIFAFNKYLKTFGFSLNHFIIQINAIKYDKLFALCLSNIYIKIT